MPVVVETYRQILRQTAAPLKIRKKSVENFSPRFFLTPGTIEIKL